MKELFRRLAATPFLTAELLAASLFVNVLSILSPLMVTQILNRYTSHGYDGTLYALTSGMALATLLASGFRIARERLAAAVNAKPDAELADQTLAALATAKTAALDRVPRAKIAEVTASLQTVQAAYDVNTIQAVLDAPFCLLFLAAIGLIHPTLGLVTLAALLISLAAGLIKTHQTRAASGAMQEAGAAHRGLVMSALTGSDAVRAFQAQGYLRQVWRRQRRGLEELRERLSRLRLTGQGFQITTGEFLRLGLYAVGAKLAVTGDVSVGALIGVSIMGSKVLSQVSLLLSAATAMGQAAKPLKELREFIALPREAERGTALKSYSGRLEIKDMAFGYSGAVGPLFESLNLRLEPGALLVVQGRNGSGKTTLARLLAGLLEPQRGQILADGVDLRQLAAPWWRSQIVYLPQEPTFLNGPLRENILAANPRLQPEGLAHVIQAAGLNRFLDESRDGLETRLLDGGRNLPLGVRRRLALARALATDGRLVILDEPTEGLDAEGTAAVLTVVGELARRGRTIVAMTQDPTITRAARAVLDLNVKPTPRLMVKEAPAHAAA